MKIRKAIIPTAGLGTRFLPIAKSLPKEMLPILNKPVIQYSVEEAVACGIEEIVIVTTPGNHFVENAENCPLLTSRIIIGRDRLVIDDSYTHIYCGYLCRAASNIDLISSS